MHLISIASSLKVQKKFTDCKYINIDLAKCKMFLINILTKIEVHGIKYIHGVKCCQSDIF